MVSFDKGVRVEVHDRAFVELLHRPDFRDEIVDIGNGFVASEAALRAPKRTGFGASTIHAEPVLEPDGWVARVSWSRDAYYLQFHEFGTQYMDEDPFLEPAAREFQ